MLFQTTCRGGVLLAVVTLTAGCSELAPDAVLAPAAHHAASAAPVVLLPNGTPYRAAAYSHGTGRSGGAQLAARALLGRDGTVDIDVTTGEFGGEAPHQIERLQIKSLAEDGSVMSVHNTAVAAPTGSYQLAGLPPHSVLQVQGTVEVPNPRGRTRTGVVTVTETVNLRPDLRVTSVSAPSEALVAEPVDIVANVVEQNGDLSASADCVLYVDGSEVDRSTDIWVAEGDAVACVFTHAFSTGGVHDITVAVEDVDPGDFDPSDNSLDGRIDVLEAAGGVATYTEAQAIGRHGTTANRFWGSDYSEFREREWDYTETVNLDAQRIDYTGRAPSRGLGATVDLHFSLRSNGSTLIDETFPAEHHTSDPQWACHWSWRSPGPGNYLMVQACDGTMWGFLPEPTVQLRVELVTGQAVYLSTGYNRTREWNWATGTWGDWYLLSNTYVDSNGPLLPWGTEIQLHVSATDGSGTYTGDVAIPLAWQHDQTSPGEENCYDIGIPDSGSIFCSQHLGTDMQVLLGRVFDPGS